MNRVRSHLANLLVFALCTGAILAAGCGRRSTGEPIASPDAAWQKAKNLFEHERYVKAQQVLKDISLNYPGAAIIDSVQFLLARTSFEIGEYLAAADQFRRIVEQYPQSTVGGDAEYWEARSYYAQSPPYQLDQAYTTKAVQGFQRYLEEHPQHSLTDSAYKYLGLCREKLAHKEYAAALLYYNLEEYASAVLYADVVLSNYYDTPWAGPAQFLKGRSFYVLEDWERARKELQTYVEKYPAGASAARAREMLSTADRRTSSAGRLPQP